MSEYVLALDQGTTSSRAILFDRQGQPVASAGHPIRQIYPQSGWVEHAPRDIWQSQLASARDVLKTAGARASQLAAIGITNQRETTILWDRQTGEPLANAIVWQCRRTAPLCQELKARGLEPSFRQKTGLVIDPYFSGTKVAWLLDNIPGARASAESGDLLFGTVDSWLLYKLTGGRVHATDYTNASRTLMFNISSLAWDEDILAELAVPPSLLPAVLASCGVFGESAPSLLGAAIPIAGIAGDQQAALFGQACFQVGMGKNTYGTGCFVLMNVGHDSLPLGSSLVTTIAWGLGQGVEYALEGSIFIAGAAVQWLRDGLGLIATATESEAVAASVPSSEGVYVVPAFVGLGAPHWDPLARGAIVGISRGTTRAHLVRATLEAIAFQTRDVIETMESECGLTLPELRVDGGAAANDLLMQIQADILGREVVRPAVTETTALGAAYLAGLAVGFWQGQDDLAGKWRVDKRFQPRMDTSQREELYQGWKRAIERAKGWATE
ncbi:MAG: glycerol kinase GlpK [Dehalococcoidia bacterium]|nr:MAG: glycerol kinase GlpK [Dehalococcoidia bacterium]